MSSGADSLTSRVVQALRHAEDACRRGEWAIAEQTCRVLLQDNPGLSGALQLLGAVYLQTGRTAEAAGLMSGAVAANPRDARLQRLCALALTALGRLPDALRHYDLAVALEPGDAQSHQQRGDLLFQLGQLQEALSSYHQALLLKPDQAEAQHNRGVTLLALLRPKEALESFERALAIDFAYADAWYNRGLALAELGRPEEALVSYERALQLRPAFAEAAYNRGLTLRRLGRLTEALAAYSRALEIRAGFPWAHNNRGVVLQALGRTEEALGDFDLALRGMPAYAEAWYNRGNACSELKQFEAAMRCYDRCRELAPQQDWLYGAWLHTRMQLCDWRDLEAHRQELADGLARGERVSAPFPVLAFADSVAAQRQAGRLWSLHHDAALRDLPAAAPRARGGKIRIGYYSADFHQHATAYLIAELIETHDRERFELLAFSFGRDQNDAMRQRLVAAFDQFHDVRTRSDRDVALLSREAGVDIAIDLKGFTQQERHRIFAYRAAPLQVSYLGYPGTMGVPYIDYLVADAIVVPEHSRHEYAEKIICLPDSYQVNDRKRRIAERRFSREELGLPAAAFVFCCFNNSYKITPAVFAAWMRILAQVGDSVLWLLEDNPAAAQQLRRAADEQGIRPDRLVFAPRMALPEHLARHAAADLFLDTLPCNAHTTASDALWAGLPLLTQAGASFAARVAASLLTAVGLAELITGDAAQYETLAIALAREPARLAALRDRLARSSLERSPLFDTGRYTRNLERAYEAIHERCLSGQPPDHLILSSVQR